MVEIKSDGTGRGSSLDRTPRLDRAAAGGYRTGWRRSRAVVGVTALLLGLTVGVPASAAAAPAEGWDPEAVALADEWRVPIEEAQARIDRQEPAEELAQEAGRVFGARHGGVWIDQANRGTVTVGFVGEVDRARLDELAARHGLRGYVTGVVVRHGADTLERIVDVLSETLPAANERARIPLSVGLRTDLNRVEIAAPASPTAAQAEFIERARGEFGDALALDLADLAPETTACAFPHCDPPLRGGLGIHVGSSSNPGSCTAGFMTRSKVDSKLYVLTAGHCADAAPTSVWWSRHEDKSVHNIGKPWNWVFGTAGDMGIIRIDQPNDWDPAPWVYVAKSSGGYPTTLNATYPIKKIGLSGGLIGKYLCKTGQTSGTSCGKLQAVGVTVSYPGTTVKKLGRAGMTVCRGDSGGPVYVKNVGYGLVSGGLLNSGTGCGGTMYYQGVTGAANALNVNVLVSP